jgi:general secretion pathway protein D
VAEEIILDNKPMIKNQYLNVVVFIFILFFSTTLLGDHSVTDSQTKSTDKITLSLDNADVTELIRWASNITDKNIILHPNVKGRVTVLAGEPMSAKEAYEVFLSVLQVHGLSIVEENGSLKVIPNVQAKQSAIPLVSEVLASSGEDTVVQVVRAKNISATHLVNLLRPLVPETGYLAAYPQTNTIILADRVNNIRKLSNIISRIDRVGTIDIELIPLEFADAKTIITVLEKLLPKQTSGQQNQSDSSFNLAVDERSNSVLMTGDQVTRQQIRSLIKRLDQPLQGIGNTHVIRVQYANAVDLVPLLESVSGSIQKDAKTTRITNTDVSIQAHEQLNALVISAPPSLLTTIRGVVAELDVPRAQVLVEALIVEVNEDLVNNLGIEWQTNPANAGEGVVGGFTNFPGDISPLSLGDNGALNLGSGLSLGYFRNGDLRGIVNALTGEANANILSTPTIVSLDNEEAEILVGSNVPFITGSQTLDGSSDPFQTIERQDIGITLKVKPRINNNDSVTLEIEQTVESIAQSAANTADIVTNKREIKTRVLVGNDNILVLGGLIRDEVTDGENKVPLLGDIPVLGNLFKSKSTTVTKNNLMVFLHPRILHNPESLKAISQNQYNKMRGMQQQFDNEVERFWITADSPLLPELQQEKESATNTESP